MLVVAIILLILNIFLTLFFLFKLSKKFADVNIIKEVKKEAQRLIADIAFQTDKSVTVLEDKIKQANTIIKELERRIVLFENEEAKRADQTAMLKNLANEQKQKKSEKESPSPNKNEDAVKIYTKQVLVNQNSETKSKASFNEQILEMAKKGFSLELIAEKVPLPMGEIELIISMNG